MIALFEGSSGGRINTWDEQYLSLGTLHYAVGQGSGARFLMRVRELDAGNVRRILGTDFDAAIAGGVASIQRFCRANVWRSQRWNRAFAELSRLPAFAQADAELAQPFLEGARNIAKRYGLTSERGLAFALDRCVQQGWGVRPAVDNVFRSKCLSGAGEVVKMRHLALTYANSANPKYRNVVLARSLTVAYGDSHTRNADEPAYPGDVNLARDFGIRQTVPWKQFVPKLFLVDPVGKTVEWNGVAGEYNGYLVNNASLLALAVAYPPGTVTTLGTDKKVKLEVFADGAMKMTRL